MCFTVEDAKMAVDAIDELLTAFEEATGSRSEVNKRKVSNDEGSDVCRVDEKIWSNQIHESISQLNGNACRQENGFHSENHTATCKRIRT
ncbi:hypothetical protein FKM82_000976 [Ascaphus truei]